MTMRAPDTAMVLAAGLGKRMRPITDAIPKPLVEVGGKPLIDWALDALAATGVERAVVNVHHMADKMTAHLARRRTPAIVLSDERDELLESAGGIVKALPLIGGEPFFVLNSDTFWVAGETNLADLALVWDTARMDILLMLVEVASATGHSGATDFLLAPDGALVRAEGSRDGYVYAGAAILHPRIFAGAKPCSHSLNVYFDRAIEAGRLFGHVMNGHWITVGTPDAITTAEAAIASHKVGK